MSKKSVFLSIISLVFMVGLLFAVVFLFAVNVVLGIIGIVLWMVIPGLLRTKALKAASGIADKVLAKYIVPVVGAILAFGTIIYIIVTQL